MSANTVKNWKIVNALQHALRDGRHGLSEVPACIIRIIKDECWREFTCLAMGGQLCAFETFTDFVSHPLPDGLGTDIRTLKNICRDNTEALDLIDRACVGKHGGDHRSDEYKTNVDNINVDTGKRPTGTSRDAALRRLRKDRPDLHERVIGGELSCHRAMVEAGFRKVLSPVEQAKKLWGKMTKAERDEFCEWMANH